MEQAGIREYSHQEQAHSDRGAGNVLLGSAWLVKKACSRQGKRRGCWGSATRAIKQWILNGKLATVQTPGGHHRIAEATLAPFLKRDAERPAAESRERFRRVSGRNQLSGKVLSVRVDGLLAEVVLSLGGQHGGEHITAIITANAVRELRLKKGDAAAALIKSTDVMIERLEEAE